MRTYARGVTVQAVPPLSEFTTMRVGGSPRALLAVDSLHQAEQTLHDLDEAGSAYWPLGGGSNTIVADDGIDATIVWLRHRAHHIIEESAESVTVRFDAGWPWDECVEFAVSKGWSGLECLSGIPGSVGGTPIQNVGAYGHDVSEFISQVTVWNRDLRALQMLTAAQCHFGYRDSIFKHQRKTDTSPTMVVLQVDFTFTKSEASAPIAYPELAARLGLQVGESAPIQEVRTAVLALRATKGMVLDDDDHDTWSVGSFFVNPIVGAALATALPAEAPRWPVGDGVKLSAAWLMEHAGFAKGTALPDSRAALSSKHALAITNRGGATAAEVVELARAVRSAVHSKFGVLLHAEPVLLGIEL
jgi:UDP-N-acetylmuramate dehydrogenase